MSDLDKKIVQYLSRNRSAAQVAAKFDLSKKVVSEKLEKGFPGFVIYTSLEDVSGDATYVAVPTNVDEVNHQDRVWSWQAEPNGQPYGVVSFPEDFPHDKIRVIPLDGILYGDPAHDSKRFNAVLARIRREPNTFCYLNGETFGVVKSGPQEDRDQVLLEWTAKLEEKLLGVSHKILWSQSGCTEVQSLNRQGFDPLEHLSKRLNIHHWKEPCHIDFFWAGNIFTLWTAHGTSLAKNIGSRANALRKPSLMFGEHINFLVSGHTGGTVWSRAVKVVRDPVRGRLLPREELHISLGNFKKYWGTDAARKSESPPSTDTAVLYMYKDGQYHVKSLTGSDYQEG